MIIVTKIISWCLYNRTVTCIYLRSHVRLPTRGVYLGGRGDTSPTIWSGGGGTQCI